MLILIQDHLSGLCLILHGPVKLNRKTILKQINNRKQVQFWMRRHQYNSTPANNESGLRKNQAPKRLHILNWSLLVQSFSQVVVLTQLFIPFVLCMLTLSMNCGTQFQVDSERQIFMGNFTLQFYFTLRIFGRNLLKGNCRRNVSHISLCQRCLT